MGWFSSAVKWVKKKVVKPIVKTVVKVTETVVDTAKNALEAAGNFISGLASTKFALSGTLEGGSGNDILVGLDLGSVLDFLKLSFTTLFSADFWRTGEIPDELKFWEGKNNAGVTLRGNSGNDTLLAFGGAPLLDGGNDNDRLLAIGGVNTLIGGSGNDTMVAAGAVNFVYGGTGNDIATVLGAGNTVRGDAGNDFLTVFGIGNDIEGGSGNDTIIGIAGGNDVDGDSGDDRIYLAGGANIARGGSDNDVVAAAGGANYLFGGANRGDGKDVIVGVGVLANFIYGDADPGNFNLIDASIGALADPDSGGDDVIVAFGFGNLIWAEGGDDIVVAFAGGQLIFGHAGDDKIVALGGGNFLFGGDGNDLIVGLGATVNALVGEGGNDTIVSYSAGDFSFGGDGDDVLVSVGPVAIGFQLGDRGSDVIVGALGTARIQFGDNPLDFSPSTNLDTDEAADENQATRDGIIGFVEQTIIDFQFTDFEFEDLSLPTLPSFDDFDEGGLDAAENFLTAAWEGTKGVFQGIGDILSALDPTRINFDGLETAWTRIEFDDFTAPTLTGLADALIPSFDLSDIGVGALEGFAEPGEPDTDDIEAVADPYESISAPTDVVGGASRLILPDAGTATVADPSFTNTLGNFDIGFSPSFLAGVAENFPGQSFNTSGLPDLSFGDLLDLPALELPDFDGLLGVVSDTLLPSGAAFEALGQTFSGLAINFEGAGLFQPGEGRGTFSLPDVTLPTLSIPDFDLYNPGAAEQVDDDILVSVAGASFLFGQEDDDLVVGAGLFNMLFGGDGADILAAIAKGNVVSGGQGDDIGVALGLMNYVSGGAGSDIIGAGGKFNVVAGGTDSDAMIAGGLANLMLGGSGRDVIASFGKFNIGVAGADDDILIGGGALNVALGGAGDDLLAGGGKLNVMLGGNGEDMLLGAGKFNAQFGGRGNDIVVGGGKFNIMDGDRGDDLVLGGGQFNVMYTRGGNDALLGGGKFNLMIAGGGTDFILGGGKFNVIMAGVEEDDADGQDHDIVLTGGSYNTFFAGAGDDLSFIGGKLNTTYLGAGQDITIGFSGGLNTVFAQGEADIVIGAGTGTLYSGGTGNDLIFGFGKDKKEQSGGGSNEPDADFRTDGAVDMRGDWGDDLMIAVGRNVFAEGGTGQDRIFSSANLSVLEGGDGYDFLFSAKGVSAMDGGTGNDVIVARATNPFGDPDAEEDERSVTDAAQDLLFDGGDVQGGFGSDLIFVHGTDLEVFGDLGTNVLSPGTTPQGDTADTRDGADYIIVSGEASQTYGGGGNDALILFGTGQVGEGGNGADLMLAMGEASVLRGGAGADQILQLGAGASAAYGDGGNDMIFGRGFGLIGWMIENGADLVTEFASNLALSIESIGDFIGSAIDSIGTFRGFDGSQVQDMAYYEGRNGSGSLPTEAVPTEEEIRQAEVEVAEAFIFNLIDQYGMEGLGSVLSEIDGGSKLAAFTPSYESLGNEVTQLGRMQVTERTDEPDVSNLGEVNISAVVLQRLIAPIYEGGAGADQLYARLGISTLRGDAGNDGYNKTVRERFTIIEERAGGGSDRLTISVSSFQSGDYDSTGGAGLTIDNFTFARVNADQETPASNDLLIRTFDGSGELQSLTIILDYFVAASRVETLVLSDGLTGDTSFDLAVLANAAPDEGNALVDAGALEALIAGDVADLDTELSVFEAYTDVALYEDFDIVNDAESDDGETYGDYETALDTYFRALEGVEPGATATADADDANDVLDGDAYEDAPVVQVAEGAGETLIQPGYTLQINRYEREGYDWFDSSLVADESSDTFVPLFVTPEDNGFDSETAIEVTPTEGVEIRLTGSGEAPVFNDAQEIFETFGFDGFDGPNDSVRSNTLLMELSFQPGENSDPEDPVEVELRGRTIRFNQTPGGEEVGLFLDLEALEGVVPILSGFRYVWASGEGRLQLGSGNESVIGDRGDQIFLMGELGNRAEGGGGDDTFLQITRDDVVVGGEGDDTFVLAGDFRGQNNREAILRGEEGRDTYVIGPVAAGEELDFGQFLTRQARIFMDEDDVIDLSGYGRSAFLREKVQSTNLDASFEIVNPNADLGALTTTQIDFSSSDALGSLRWTDGIDRQIVDTYNTAADGAGYTGPVALLPEQRSTGTLELHGSAFGDVIVSNRFTTRVEAGDGDDFIFGSRADTVINAGAGSDYIRLLGSTSAPGHVIEFDGSLFDYRIYRGFWELAVEHVPTGDLNRIDASIDAFGGVLNLDRLQFDDFSIAGADIVVGSILDDEFTIEEDATFAIGAEAAALMPEGTEEVTISLNRPATSFGEIRIGEDGPLVWALDTIDAADVPNLVFVPDPDLHSTLDGAPEEIRLDMDFLGPDGLLRTAHYGFTITPVEDDERFGTAELPNGGAIVLQEGEVFDLASLFYDDPDEDNPDRFVNITMDPGTTGARLLSSTGIPLSGNSMFERSVPIEAGSGSINVDLAENRLEIDPNAFGTITFSAYAQTFDSDTNQFFDRVDLPEFTVTWESVDDLETFSGLPAALTVEENTTGFYFPDLQIETVDQEPDALYEVHLVVDFEGMGVWASFNGSTEWTQDGIFDVHVGGARLREVPTTGPSSPDEDRVFTIEGTIEQLNAAMGTVRFRSEEQNYEGQANTQVELYRVVDGDGTLELQDSFLRELTYEPGSNIPLQPSRFSTYATPDSGPIELGLPEPFDPDFDDEEQPAFLMRVFQVPEIGTLTLEDGVTLVESFTNYSVEDWKGFIYTPSSDHAAEGARGYVESMSYYAFDPDSPATRIGKRLTFEIYDDVDEAGAPRDLTIIGRDYIGDLASNSIILGGRGDDTIRPNEGVDIISGGLGADTFIIDEDSGVFNAIGDFELGVDTLILDGLSIVGVEEDFAFLDEEDGIEDDTLDAIVTLSNGAQLIFEDVTEADFIARFNVAPRAAQPDFEDPDFDPEAPDFSIAERTTDAPSQLIFNPLNGAFDPNLADLISLDPDSLVDPENGRISVDGSGRIIYTPDIGFDGIDRFGFALTDGTDTGLTRTIAVEVVDDPLSGSNEADEIALAPGIEERAFGNGGIDILTGNELANVIFGGSGGDEIFGLGGDDTLVGGPGGDLLDGGDGDDSLDSRGGPDTMQGGAGNDTYLVNGTGDVVVEVPEEGDSDGIKLFDLTDYTMPDAVEWLTLERTASTGGSANGPSPEGPSAFEGARIVGNRSDNEITGYHGDDTIDGGEGADTLAGGEGHDLYIVDNLGDVVEEGAGEGDDTVRSAVDFDLGAGGQELENLSLFGGANTRGTGTAGANRMEGDEGANTLEGGDGEDTLTGGAGDDSLIGGGQDDQLEGGQGSDRVAGGRGDDTILGGLGNDTAAGGAQNDLIRAGSGNDEISGGSGDDTLDGWKGRDMAEGGDGADSITGGAGRDTLDGGDGDDTIDGGTWSDRITGGAGDDTIAGGTGQDEVDGGEGNDSITGGEGRDTLLGGAGDDTLDGGTFADLIDGGTENDLIYGGDGGDTLLGFDGNDTLYGGDKRDRIEGNNNDDGLYGQAGEDTLRGGQGADTLEGGADADLLWGGGGGDTIRGGQGADTLRGEGGDDSMIGGAGNDFFFGSTGADTLEGGGGSDTMQGGSSADVFVFRGSSGQDEILGYEAGLDQILTDVQPVNIVDDGTDTRIVFGGGDAVTLVGVTGISDLADDISLFP